MDWVAIAAAGMYIAMNMNLWTRDSFGVPFNTISNGCAKSPNLN